MPEKKTIERAREDKREGKSPTTQAGEFVREEMHHIREGKHGARSTKQAIAIGLSKARRAGVDLPPPEKGKTTERTRKSANAPTNAVTARRPRASHRRSGRERFIRPWSTKDTRRHPRQRWQSTHTRPPASERLANATKQP